MQTILLADKNYHNHTKSYFLARTLGSLEEQGNAHRLFIDNKELSSVFDLKVRTFRDILRKYPDEEIIMLIDAFDTYCVAPDSEIESKFLEMEADVVYSVEKNCWPEKRIGEFYESQKFLNSGGVIFKNEKFQRLLDLIIQIHDCTVNPNNQICDQYFHSVIGAIARQDLKIRLDSNSEIFQSLHSELPQSFEKLEDRFMNIETGTSPCIFHGNGDSGFHLLSTMFPAEPESEIEEWPESTAIKALMMQVWFGKMPDYFKYHLRTTQNLPGFDFLIITDDFDFQVEANNYRIIHMKKEEFANLFFKKTGRVAKLDDSKKVSDFKICLGDLFSDLSKGYSHVGFYDIDTLFSQMLKVKAAMAEDWDFITLADVDHADRLNGPFVLIKNQPNLLRAYRIPECYADLANPNKTDCDEQSYSRHICANFKVKKIWNCRNLEQHAGGKISYLCQWNDGELKSNDRLLEQYHFYHKDRTRLTQLGESTILAAYDKIFIDDFMWITGFTESYCSIGEELLRSMIKYSNRKCLVYTIDFDWDMPLDITASDQIILKRFNLNRESLQEKTRDSFINAKPLYLIDSIESFPDSKFVFIDADAHLTASADQVVEYFPDLENYPLINSHTHDDILITRDGSQFNSLSILLEQMGVTRTVYPRRKTNISVFDSRSKWFFEEQISLYDAFSNTSPGIFALHDEDSANALLSKYNLHKGLPISDMEETTRIDMSKFFSYSYAVSEISQHSVLPDNPNKIIAFHQLKNKLDFKKIELDYGAMTVSQDEIVVKYFDNCVSWVRNVYHPNPRIPHVVHFYIRSTDGSEIFRLSDQNFMNYWTFCVWDLALAPGKYLTHAADADSGRIIYSDAFEVK